MFTLVTLADVIQIPPTDFHKPSLRSIEDFINTKYADKILHKIGLCLGFHSLISTSEGLIGHGTGIVHCNVDFRLVVFRPFKGEIIRATITSANHAGIYLSVDFFEDIFVPAELLFEGSEFLEDENGVWTWIWKADDGEGGKNEFFFDRTESCLIRIEDERWTDVSPDALRSQEYATEEEEAEAKRTAPYALVASMMHSGLGPTLWWTGEGGEAAAEEAAEEAPTNGDEAMTGT